MTIAGIVLATTPEHVTSTRALVDALPWAETHHVEEGGRMVVTVEAPDVDVSMDRLLELGDLPHVVSAQMAEFYSDEAAL